MQIAFLGMGLMGAPMALNCLRAGHAVTVWNRTPEKCEPLRAAGAAVAATPAAAAQDKGIILLCVDDHAAVETVIFGRSGVLHGLEKNSTSPPLLIDHSTISPKSEAAYAKRLLELTGAQLIDAPVTGGDAGAKAGTLSIMAGGPAEAFARAEPLLRAMGKTVTQIGPAVGDGQRAKLINQMLVLINLMATTESMRMGEQAGMDMLQVLAAVGGGAAGSWSLNNLGPKWLARDFAPGFRLRHLLKDIRYAREMLDDAGGDLDAYPALKLGLALLEHAVQAGMGEQGTQSLGQLFTAGGKSKS